jgi:chaperonin cofactor prefoldin
VSVTVVGADGKPLTLTIPTSADQVQALLAQRDELAGQLSNVSNRRTNLAAELRETHDPAARTGLEQRLALLDQRILQIETDLATTGRQISSAPAELVSLAEHQNHSTSDDDYEGGLFAGGFSVLGVAAVFFFFARRRWKRAARAPAQLGGDSGPRLERLEHGMDAIALEIERISEGQRFVTKLLSESQAPFGQAQRANNPLPAEREDPAKR